MIRVTEDGPALLESVDNLPQRGLHQVADGEEDRTPGVRAFEIAFEHILASPCGLVVDIVFNASLAR